MFPADKVKCLPALKEETIMSPGDKPRQYIFGTFKTPIFNFMLNCPLLEWSFAESCFRLSTVPAIRSTCPVPRSSVKIEFTMFMLNLSKYMVTNIQGHP